MVFSIKEFLSLTPFEIRACGFPKVFVAQWSLTFCRVYFGNNRIRYDKRRRKSIYNWIHDLAAEISLKAGKEKITPVAWRVTAKQWLVKNGLIRIQMVGKVLPNFSSNLCHN